METRAVQRQRKNAVILSTACLALLALSITDNARGSSQAARISRTGTPSVGLSPAKLAFGSQSVNKTSKAQTVTLNNTGNGVLSITSSALTGTNPRDFAQTNTCGSSLAAFSRCTIRVTFTPLASGSRTASLSISDNASGSPQKVSLSGTGALTAATPTAPVDGLSPTSLAFSNLSVGTSSTPQTATLSNTGNAAMSITSLVVTGTNATDFVQTNTCGTSVAAGNNCTISVTFTPSASGSRTASVSITDNASGSPQSVSLTGTGSNPAPSLTSLSPASAVAGAGTQTLTLTGTNFLASSTVTYNGVGHTATFLSSTQLTISLSATDQATAGSYAVVVTNPAPGGGTSSALSFAVNNPAPTLSSLSPALAVAGAASQTLTLTGTNFLASSTVTYNGVGHTATFVSATQLTISLSATDQATVGSYAVVVTNPPPVGGTSSALSFAVNNPAPTLTSLSPASAVAGAASQTLTLTGTNFLASSTVTYNGVEYAATFVSATQLTISLSATDQATVGSYAVVVTNPAPGGGTSSALSFAVNNPAPTLISLSPASALAGVAAQTLTLTGTNFVASSTVAYNGVGHTATFVSSTQLTISLSAADQATGGIYAVVVTNPGPGGGASSVNFAVNNPAPTLTGLSPASAAAGAASQTLTLTGTNFVASSTVTYNGVGRTATFVSSTQLTISLSAADQATVGSYAVVVTNPGPGGGASNALNFAVTVSNPSQPITFVQSTSTSQTSGQASSTAFPGGVTSGDLIIVGVFVDVGATVSVVDTLGSTFTQVANQTVASGHDADVFVGTAGTSGAETITVNAGSGSNVYAFSIHEYSGVTTAVDAFSTTQGNSTAPASGSLMTVTPNDLVFAWFTNGNNFENENFSSLNAAYTKREMSGSGTTQCYGFANCVESGDLVASTTLTTNATATLNVADVWSATAVAFKGAASTLTGTGTAVVASLSPTSLTFGSQLLGTPSTAQAVTLSNTSNAALSITSLVLTGTNASDFAPTNNCGSSVAAGTNCTISVTFTPTASGTRTAAVTLTDNAIGSPQTVSLSGAGINPQPSLTTLSPASALAGAAAQTLTLTGTNFLASSTVTYNGVGHTATFVSSTQLTISLSTSDQATAGTYAVVVTNPTPGGGVSNSVSFAVNNGMPTITTLSPTSATAGAAFTLTVTGTNLVSGSTVQWNGTGLTTTYVSGTQVTASVPASDIATAGTASVTVLNPSPGGGTSSTLTFTINNPLPTATSLSATSATAGGAAFTLTVTGTNLVSGSTVQWNGTGLTTTYVSGTQVTASVPASDIATAGTASVTVLNPSPGGGTSSALTFTINNPLPTATSLSPTSATAGAAAQTLTINGTNFLSTSTVTYNTVAHASTFVSSTELTISLSATDQATAGSYAVVVTNPAPGGGASSPVNFAVGNPQPTLTSLSPASAVVGAAAQTLTLAGTNFLASSTVTYNGVGHTATFVSSTQLRISLSAADQAAAGSYAVVVTNPGPGGGASSPVNFAVGNPQPTLTSLSPASAVVGAAAQTLTLTGTNFLASSTVTYNGVGHTATFVSSTQLRISLSAADQAAAGSYAVVVTNPGPGGGASSAVNFAVGNPQPTLTSLSPASAAVGAAAQTLTLTGTNFLASSTVTYNGVGHAATFVSSTQLRISLSVADQATVGSYAVVVTNPTPGGGASNSVSFTVVASPIVSLSTTSLAFGSQPIDVTSTSPTVTLSNTGNATLSITSLTMTGTNSSDFEQTNTCGSSVAAGTNCTIVVMFTPSIAGTETASLSIADNASGNPQTVSLSGAGTHDVILTWTASTTPGVVGYNVFRGATSGGESATPLNSSPINGTTYCDSTAQAGQTYYYVVTAVASNDVTQSADSNQVSATVPQP